ncbi:MAG: 4-hydroxy-tetrahydrodipicolinate reductase [Flavobacteriaceae bacterium]|nr:4-hydroxy-tetrahydrodipicolinate reductase [Flavobacteriaceae bacterium]MCY4254407.1 4-hydroxy-tetrahydrodipicolinate reductase [Flavobacteriaceae bacterium]
MKIAIFGYGKMGQLIEKMALRKSYQVVYIQDLNFSRGTIDQASLAIVFSSPNAVVENIEYAFKHKLNVVCGSTGWLKDYKKVTQIAKQYNCGFLYASNFSIGVNILFEMNRKLAKIMKPLNDYEVSISETHHIEKVDKPSGTALSLAEDLIQIHQLKNWTQETASKQELQIESFRKANVVGEHQITYHSEIDTLSLVHQAHHRDGFATGALVAAKWIEHKKGVFTMSHVLSDNFSN